MTFVVVALLLAGVACSREEPAAPPPRPPPPDVVAVYDGGEVTRGQLDAWVLALPPDQRLVGPEERLAWYEELLRGHVLQELLVRGARAAGAESDPAFQRMLRAARRRSQAEQYLARALPQPATPSEAALRARYEAEVERFEQPGRRLVRHWYKRMPEGGDPGPAIAELEALRARLAAGESFEALARDHSDSQSRHQGGALGWLERDAVSPGMADAIFGLEVGVTSPPVVLGSGVHVFLVDQAIPEKRFAFEEVRALVLREWLAEERGRAIEVLLEEHPLPADSRIPTAAKALALLRDGRPDDVALRIGKEEVWVEELRRYAAELSRQTPESPPGERAARLLRGIEAMERIVQTLGTEGEADAGLEERVLAGFFRERELRRVALAEADLRGFHATHRLRFASPLRLRLRRYQVPLGSDPDRTMAALEEQVSAGGALDSLARARGGTVDDLGWISLPELAAQDALGARLAADLPPGASTPPHRLGATIGVFEVLAREEPAPRAFEEVREAVERAWLERHGQELYERWVEETLAAAGYRSFPDRLAAGPG